MSGDSETNRALFTHRLQPELYEPYLYVVSLQLLLSGASKWFARWHSQDIPPYIDSKVLTSC